MYVCSLNWLLWNSSFSWLLIAINRCLLHNWDGAESSSSQPQSSPPVLSQDKVECLMWMYFHGTTFHLPNFNDFPISCWWSWWEVMITRIMLQISKWWFAITYQFYWMTHHTCCHQLFVQYISITLIDKIVSPLLSSFWLQYNELISIVELRKSYSLDMTLLSCLGLC